MKEHGDWVGYWYSYWTWHKEESMARSADKMLSADAQGIVGYLAGCWFWCKVIEEDQGGGLHPHQMWADKGRAQESKSDGGGRAPPT